MTSRMEAARRAVHCPECGALRGSPCVGIQHKGTTACVRDVESYGDRCIAHRSAAQCRKWEAVGLPLHHDRSHNGRLDAFWRWQQDGQAALRRAQLAEWLRLHGHILSMPGAPVLTPPGLFKAKTC